MSFGLNEKEDFIMKKAVSYILLLAWICVSIPISSGYRFINKIAPTKRDKLDLVLVGALIGVGYAMIWLIMAVVASL